MAGVVRRAGAARSGSTSAGRQLVVLVRSDRPADEAEQVRDRRAVVLSAPGPAARSRAARLGRSVVVCPELAPAAAGHDRRHRLDVVVRGHAVQDRWRDVVVVADPDTLAEVAAGLGGLASGEAPRDVEAVALPRGPRPVRPVPVLVGGVLLALLVGLTLERWHPLVLPSGVAACGLLLWPWRRVRHLGLTLLAVAGLAAVLVFLTTAGSSRFPVQ